MSNEVLRKWEEFQRFLQIRPHAGKFKTHIRRAYLGQTYEAKLRREEVVCKRTPCLPEEEIVRHQDTGSHLSCKASCNNNGSDWSSSSRVNGRHFPDIG